MPKELFIHLGFYINILMHNGFAISEFYLDAFILKYSEFEAAQDAIAQEQSTRADIYEIPSYHYWLKQELSKDSGILDSTGKLPILDKENLKMLAEENKFMHTTMVHSLKKMPTDTLELQHQSCKPSET